ncbi:MAG TPA: PEP-CTERM sorting domain-containing protein [Caulobacteraceae bacterium]|nr:PEP-CTERM sorting domain-containing protein [Caulobacteraceae bacterium]
MLTVVAKAISPLALSVLLAGAAHAALVTDDVTFSATDLTSVYGQSVPVDPVTGEFQITFDPTQTYTDDTSDITLLSLNITLGSSLSFDYSPTGNANGSADQLVVGGVEDGAAVIQDSPSTDDFYLHIDDFTTAPAFQQLGYTQTSVGSADYFYTAGTTGSVDVTPVTSVPEPAAWTLLLLGVGMTGAWLRTARRVHPKPAVA